MPKRAYPFPETFSLQYKMHVGEQDLHQSGVFGSKYRKEIYEKTKNLLFNGAKAVVGKIWAGEEAAPPPAGAGQTLLRGQTIIGHDGKLARTSGAQDGTNYLNSVPPGPPAAPSCCCVCQKSRSLRSLCSQCDRRVCASCTRQCSSCSSPCCSVCTIIDYSGPYDEVLCCGCST
ncbi:apoptosis regulatory protein Siva [Neosynchiropus ocellatus]